MFRGDQSFTRRRGRLPRRTLYFAIFVIVCAPVVFLVMGITGLSSVLHTQDLLRPVPGGAETTGRVVSTETSCGSSNCTYAPLIKFSDQNGLVHTFRAPYQDNFPPTGSHVRVSYDPRTPSVAHDISVSPTTWNLQLSTSIFAIVVSGLWLALIARVAVRLLLRRRRRRGTAQSLISSLG
jgi:hypothetical protein